MRDLWRQAGAASSSMDEEEEQSHYGGGERGSMFGARRLKPRSNGNHQLLLMGCVGDADGASKETVPLPDYERLPQSTRLPDDPDPKSPAPRQRLAVKQSTSPPRQQQKPAAWRLIEYVVRSRHNSSSGCGSSDGDSKSSDGEKEAGIDGGEEGKKNKKKKRSSWLPDPDRRWPVQGFY